ncbi:hypothetical protein SAMN04488101_10356 [Pedobacter nyackensis]|uniref:Dolichyl-phosphate-mannose-protein mannosyltransferase n=1 Tax=Pedobacter nyackensis TaxID=475255 RepID=A0A1W2C1X1_9SPHI|nr:hypothetical protein SAMN04488101_10356 [Pedobacter nyackensis]
MLNFNEIISLLISISVLTFLSTIILYYYTKRFFFSVSVSIIKYAFCFIYFVLWVQYRPIILLDDQTYYEQSIVIFEKANGSLTYLFSFKNIAFISSLAGGTHFGYYIYNFISFIIFGQNYYSPVILNILFSVITGIIIYKTLLLAKLDKKFCIFFLLFFLLHWDILSWSSFINLKDILVLFFVVWALNCMIRLKEKGNRLFLILNLLLIGTVLLFFRFYLVYFLIVSGVVYMVITQMYKVKSRWTGVVMRSLVLIVMPVSFYLVFIKVFSASLAEIGGATNVVSGFIRFILTPLPFSIEENYSFLFISSLLHWMMLPFIIYGTYLFLKRYFISLMPFVILALLLCVFYGSFGELQGPRHRVLLLYFVSLTQALSIYEFLILLSKSKQKICVESLEQQ